MANMSVMLQKARKEIAIVDPGAAQQGWLLSNESYLNGNPVGCSLSLTPMIFVLTARMSADIRGHGHPRTCSRRRERRLQSWTQVLPNKDGCCPVSHT